MDRPCAVPELPTDTASALVVPDPVALLVKVLVHILRRDPPRAARHRRRQAAVPRPGEHAAAEPLDRLVVPLEDDPRAALVFVVPVAVLDRVRVQVRALRDRLEELRRF